MRMKTFRPYAADAMRSNMRNDDQGGRANLPGSPRKSADGEDEEKIKDFLSKIFLLMGQ